MNKQVIALLSCDRQQKQLEKGYPDPLTSAV